MMMRTEITFPFITHDGQIIEKITCQKEGIYVMFRIPKVKRGIRGKTRSQVDELMIVGIPWKHANKWLEKYGIEIHESN